MSLDAEAVITINGRQLDPVQAGAMRTALSIASKHTHRGLCALADDTVMPSELKTSLTNDLTEQLSNIRLIERFANMPESDQVTEGDETFPRIIFGLRKLTLVEVNTLSEILEIESRDSAVALRLSNYLDFIDA